MTAETARPIVWTADLHMHRLEEREFLRFAAEVDRLKPAALLLAGDISRAKDLSRDWNQMALSFRDYPLYFVPGNHDYYHGSIDDVDASLETIHGSFPWINVLHGTEVVPISEECALVGHRGWGDGLAGNARRSMVHVNDFMYIEELRKCEDRNALFDRLESLGREAAERLAQVLPEALGRFQTVLVLTHAPPFPEACLYEGKASSPDYLPHFCCASVGQILVKLANRFPDRRIQVLCGHTHHGCEYSPVRNLQVSVAASDYGRAKVHRLDLSLI